MFVSGIRQCRAKSIAQCLKVSPAGIGVPCEERQGQGGAGLQQGQERACTRPEAGSHHHQPGPRGRHHLRPASHQVRSLCALRASADLRLSDSKLAGRRLGCGMYKVSGPQLCALRALADLRLSCSHPAGRKLGVACTSFQVHSSVPSGPRQTCGCLAHTQLAESWGVACTRLQVHSSVPLGPLQTCGGLAQKRLAESWGVACTRLRVHSSVPLGPLHRLALAWLNPGWQTSGMWHVQGFLLVFQCTHSNGCLLTQA